MDKINQELFEQIELYLSGEMADEDKVQFERLMQTDKALQAEVQLHKELAATLHDPAEAAFQTILSEVDRTTIAAHTGEATAKSKGRIVSFQKLAMAAAAMLVLAAGALLFLPGSPNAAGLAASNIGSYEAPSALRAPTDESKQLSKEGFAAYNEGNFETAAEKLAGALANSPNHPDMLFFLGLSLLETGDATQALSTFETLGMLGETQWSNEAEWHLMLALLQAESFSSAKLLCQRIVENQGPFAAKASKLLPKIEKLARKSAENPSK